jgi:hypothetical protein
MPVVDTNPQAALEQEKGKASQTLGTYATIGAATACVLNFVTDTLFFGEAAAGLICGLVGAAVGMAVGGVVNSSRER